jgi:hypothetical protein
MNSINSEVTLEISYSYTLDSTPIDVRGIFQYADGTSDKTLQECLKNPLFAAKYKDMETINR